MPDPPTAATRLFLLLGDPVEHSLSPRFQNAAIRERGIDAVYAALRCESSAVATLMRALCHAGGGGNITTPHKAAAAAAIERPAPAVVRTGVCNTFWGDADGVICGDNTDVHGFLAAASAVMPTLHGATLLVLGAGGAAAAAVVAAMDAGARSVHLLNRSPGRAEALARRLDPRAATIRVCASAAGAEGRDFDLVVNATTLGLRPADPLPFDLARAGSVRAVLDMTYAQRRATPLVQHARALGLAAADGSDMLLAQGAAAFVRWFGGDAPLAIMRAAIAADTVG
jgi:shikimate dehydrogenase